MVARNAIGLKDARKSFMDMIVSNTTGPNDIRKSFFEAYGRQECALVEGCSEVIHGYDCQQYDWSE